MWLRQIIKTNVRSISRVAGSGRYSADAVLIPTEPEISQIEDASTEAPHFDKKLILQLESLSLLRFDDEQAVALLGAVVRKAKQLRHVDVENSSTMFTVWEQLECPVNDDVPSEGCLGKKVLSNAARTMDNYFVSPPGNIPLAEAGSLDLDLISQWDKIGLPRAFKPKKQKSDISSSS
uniref:Glutamyl-tRNA(Gln) amidotransferase subunit C, mitochondrial n=1 Tax=Haemonchus contortus TaxID=6289 RepID=W6NTN1_HAECO